MSSKESVALRDAYKAMAGGVSDVYGEGISRVAAEPAEVTYEEVTAAGLPAIWANPVGSDGDRVVVYFHGGGFVSGSKDSHRKLAAHLAKAAGCRALIPDYRLAPEHTFPAQLDDARALYDWLLGHDYAASKIAFAGDSAGGNIATAAVLALKRDNLPLPGAVVAFSPWYDQELGGKTVESNAATDAFLSPEGAFISPELGRNAAAMLLGGHSPTDPLANPLYSDPAGMSPIFLTSGTHESLQDNAERFAALARRAGVDVVLQVAEEMQHAFQCMAGRAPEADASLAEAGKWLLEKLGR
jgi:epsilon-lactone hydrolase